MKMKGIGCLALVVMLLFPAFVQAERLHMLIIDRDATGTNVRESPAGRIVETIPTVTAHSDNAAIARRSVDVTGQKGEWFSVTYGEGKKGWMHQSVLGTCASPTEEGVPPLFAEPRARAKILTMVPDMTRLSLRGIAYQDQMNWAKVSCTIAGRNYIGWLPEQCMFSNPYSSCWE